MKKTVLWAVGATFASVLFAAGAASAATSTSNFQVNMTIQGECRVSSASTLDFGAHGVLDSATDTTSAIGVTCTNSTPYTVALSAGAGSGATTTARKMTSAANDTLSYAVYRDAGRTQVWGANQNVDTQAATGTGAVQTFTAYGRVPVQTTPAQGSFTDTVAITITY